MDHQDAIEINEQIETLKNNELLIADKVASQHSLNTQMIDRFNNITSFINMEQAKLKIIVDTIKSYPHIEQQLFQSQFFFSIQTQLQYLDQHINDIILSIELAKLNVISKHILTKPELSLIYKSLQDEIEIKSDEHLYELLPTTTVSLLQQ